MNHQRAKSADRLTRREFDVLLLLSEGLSNQEVADRLLLGLGTVKWHTIQIYAKLDVHSRARAVIQARQLGILPANPPIKQEKAAKTVNGLSTLRSAIDWSYNQLPVDAQTVFAALSVFVGGWTQDAAQAVCAQVVPSAPIDETLKLLHMSGLIEVTTTPSTRFSMRDTIQQVALEKREALSQETILRAAHAAHFLMLTEQAEKALYSSDQAHWLDCLRADYWNTLEAVDYFHSQSDGIEAELRMVGTLAWYWIHFADHEAGSQRVQSAMQRDREDIATEARARAYLGAAKMERSVGGYAIALKHYEKSLTLFRAIGSEWETARALLGLALAYYCLRDIDRSLALTNDAIAIVQRLNDLPLLVRLYNNQANNLIALGRREQALSMYQEALAVSQSLRQVDIIMVLLGNLGQMYCLVGDYEQASDCFHEAIGVSRRLQNRHAIALGLFGLAAVALAKGQYLDAGHLLSEGMAIVLELGDVEGTCEGLMLQARLAFKLEDYETALSLAREALTTARIGATQLLTEEALDFLALLAARDGNPTRAVRLFGALESTRSLLANHQSDADNAAYEQTVSSLRQQFEDDRFADVWAEGSAMSIEEAVEYALTNNVTIFSE